MEPINPNLKWSELLKRAVTEPGRLSEAYSRFHGYSIGNRMLALEQCLMRGIEPGPIASYHRWQELGRQVRKGQKALMLCMPISVKRQAKDEPEEKKEDETYTIFTYRNNWFALSQTEGKEYKPEPISDWSRADALTRLNVSEVQFDSTDGNVLGYAREHTISINPLNEHPEKTTFHELAHILFGHTVEGALADSEKTPRSLREVESESVTLICLESLGLKGSELSRGYIQSWLSGADIPDKSAQKIFKVADQILKAGQCNV